MRKIMKTTLVGIGALALTAASALFTAGAASAYQPTPTTIYSTNGSTCNKGPCVLYPKTAQLPGGRVVAAFEDSEGPVAGQTLPIYKSDDNGDSWQKLTDLKAPAQVSSDSAYSQWTSNWTNPYFYVLPQAFGGMPAGTLLLADLVSSSVTGSNDRPAGALILWSSSDQGATWKVVSTIASTQNMASDPIWEPFVMLYQGQLVVYYSDENDYLGYDSGTGVATLDPNNATATDSGGQVLLHRTWSGSGAWSSPVIDEAGTVQDMGNGKTEIGGNRPGMTTVAPTTDGKWIMTYEYGTGNQYKIAADPLKFFTATGSNVANLPVASGSGGLSGGGSPVVSARPDGAIMYNAPSSGDVWVNESGSSTGTWKEYHTTIGGGYSREMQYLSTTGQVLIVMAPWGNGPVTSAVVDFGHSVGTYYTLVNRATGQVLAPAGGRTQDAQFTGNAPDIGTQARNDADATQWWHLVKKGTATTLLNKSGGRALGLWQGSVSSGSKPASWVDDNGSDKKWNIVTGSDGYVRLQASGDTSLALTASSTGAVDLESDTASTAQQWQVVVDFSTTANSTFTLQNRNSGKALGIYQAATADGANAVQWASNGSSDQQWRITVNGSGNAVLTNVNSGKTLGIYQASTAAGAQAVQWTANSSTDQQWGMMPNGAFYSLKNAKSGLLLGVNGGSTADGASAVQWTADSSTNQQWTLVQTSTF
jgi:hypothetical protein